MGGCADLGRGDPFFAGTWGGIRSDALEVWERKCLVEEAFEWCVEAEVDESSVGAEGVHEVGLHAVGCLATDGDVHGVLELHLAIGSVDRLVAAQHGRHERNSRLH